MYKNCRTNKIYCCSSSNDKSNMLENICDDMLCHDNCKHNDECTCGFDEEESVFPVNPMFGQSYVANQILNKTFTPEVGLRMGTIFPELVSPYVPGQSMDEIDFIKKTNKIKEGCNRV